MPFSIAARLSLIRLISSGVGWRRTAASEPGVRAPEAESETV